LIVLELREAGFDLYRALNRVCDEIDALLDTLLAVPDDPSAPLFEAMEAMRHAAIGGGKRLRPLLVQASADLFDVPREWSVRAGLAVECIHVHSLIHDDLPCMDDDDLRRGKPTVHCVFDEATAVLAGDSLLALAFEILSDPATHASPGIRAVLVRTLARAAGPAGMAGGQMLDLLAPGLQLGLEGVGRLQRLKTGALIGWCVGAGGAMGRASTQARQCLENYAQCLGLAFQIADDLLDDSGDEARTGKRVGKDLRAGKETFVSLLGGDRAREHAEALVREAREHLEPFGSRAEPLRALADFAVSRDH
jgi:farnesyl diphosphate synthase